ncbi:MAG TPA: YtxH domain-containing protein [Patescibacteria group bacterium]
MTESKDHHQGSFLSGFTVGLFAGAAGYFLFGTDKGQKLTEKLSDEWESAKERLADEGVIDNPNMSLRQVVGQVLNQVKERIETPEMDSQKANKPSKTNASKTAKKPVRKFKNISL